MSEIQAQVEQFKRERLQRQGTGHLAERDFYALLRQVVEECCKTIRSGSLYYLDDCEVRILEQFAWLLEGE